MSDWNPSQRVPDAAVHEVDGAFAKLRLPLCKIERLHTGTRWAEGPVWMGDARCLLWSDVPGNQMLRWDEESGAVTVWRRPSGHANGNTRDRQGRLLTCEHSGRRVSRTELDGKIVTLADSFESKKLNSPNDVVCKSDGSVWFTDPVFGIVGYNEGVKAEAELPTHVYRWEDGKNGGSLEDPEFRAVIGPRLDSLAARMAARRVASERGQRLDRRLGAGEPRKSGKSRAGSGGGKKAAMADPAAAERGSGQGEPLHPGHDARQQQHAGDAGPGQRFLPHRHAIADRLAARQHVIEIARIGIDHDRSGHFLAVIFDDVALVGLRNGRLFVGRRSQKLLVARRQIGFRRRLQRRLTSAKHQAGAEQDCQQPPRGHLFLFPGTPKTRPPQTR